MLNGKETPVTSEGLRTSQGFTRIEVKNQPTFDLAEKLGNKVIGQEKACMTVAQAVLKSQAGFRNPNQPLSSMLFTGPTGVGKTELAKGLAQELYLEEWERHIIIVDCAALKDAGSVTRLKGTEPKWTGYGDPTLIPPAFLKEGGVIVFDEIEKAHPEIWQWLMSVLDRGKATAYVKDEAASAGGNVKAAPQELNFNKTHVIMTSNEGSKAMQEARLGTKKEMGFVKPQTKQDSPEETALKALRSGRFREYPEFLGRIKSIVAFSDLEPAHYRAIFDKMIGQIVADYQLVNPNDKLTLVPTEELKDHILATGVKKEFGARDLRNAIDNILISAVVDLKASQVVPPNTPLVCDIENGKVVFWTSKAEEQKPPVTALVVHESYRDTPIGNLLQTHTPKNNDLQILLETDRPSYEQVISEGVQKNIATLMTGNTVFQTLLREKGLDLENPSNMLIAQIGRVAREFGLDMSDKRIVYMTGYGTARFLRIAINTLSTDSMPSDDHRFLNIVTSFMNEMTQNYAKQLTNQERLIFSFLTNQGNKAARDRVIKEYKAGNIENALRLIPRSRRVQ